MSGQPGWSPIAFNLPAVAASRSSPAGNGTSARSEGRAGARDVRRAICSTISLGAGGLRGAKMRGLPRAGNKRERSRPGHRQRRSAGLPGGTRCWRRTRPAAIACSINSWSRRDNLRRRQTRGTGAIGKMSSRLLARVPALRGVAAISGRPPRFKALGRRALGELNLNRKHAVTELARTPEASAFDNKPPTRASSTSTAAISAAAACKSAEMSALTRSGEYLAALRMRRFVSSSSDRACGGLLRRGGH